MRYFVERWAHWLGATACALVAICYLHCGNHVPSTMKELLTSAISVGAIAVGFLITVNSILFATDDKPGIVSLKQMRRYDVVLTYMVTALKSSFWLATVSAIALLVDFEHPPTWAPWGFVAWSFIAGCAGAAGYRFMHIFSAVLLCKASVSAKPPADQRTVSAN